MGSQGKKSPSNKSDLPDIATAIGPLLAEIAKEHQPLFVAIAERMAATRYRLWAKEAALASYRGRLLGCADREEDIASRIEGLVPESDAVQRQLHKQFPNLQELNNQIFAEWSLQDQLTIQARGERLGAATWRSFAAQADDQSAQATFAACAALEEASAEVLEEILGAIPFQ